MIKLLNNLIKKNKIKIISKYNKGKKSVVTFSIDINTLKKLTPNQIKQLAIVMSIEIDKKKIKHKKHKDSKPPKWAIAMENRIVNRINSRIDNLVSKNNLKE